MDENYLATYQIITTKKNEVERDGGVITNKWRNSIIAAGEGIGLLDLITNIVKNTKELDSGEVVIYNDNKKLIREINKEVKKESDYTQEAEAITEGIRCEIKKAQIDIKIEYANDKPYSNLSFEQQPGQMLMKQCDKKAKNKCATLIDTEEICNVKHVGIASPVMNEMILDKNINVLVRELDTKKNE